MNTYLLLWSVQKWMYKVIPPNSEMLCGIAATIVCARLMLLQANEEGLSLETRTRLYIP